MRLALLAAVALLSTQVPIVVLVYVHLFVCEKGIMTLFVTTRSDELTAWLYSVAYASLLLVCDMSYIIGQL